MKILYKFSFILLLSSCSILQSKTFYKPGISYTEELQDSDFCESYSLRRALIETRYSSSVYLFARTKDEAKEECFTELGYKWRR